MKIMTGSKKNPTFSLCTNSTQLWFLLIQENFRLFFFFLFFFIGADVFNGNFVFLSTTIPTCTNHPIFYRGFLQICQNKVVLFFDSVSIVQFLIIFNYLEVQLMLSLQKHILRNVENHYMYLCQCQTETFLHNLVSELFVP